MALMKAKDFPSDAVVLDETEAVNYIWDLIYKWEPKSDTWPIRYSVAVLGGLNSLSGIIINNHFRRKLKLGTYGHLSSLIPMSMMPGIFTAIFHRHFVTTDILLMKKETCAMCYELRSATIQCIAGILYPMILAPATSFMLANKYATYRLPVINEDPKGLLKVAFKISKSLSGTLVFLGTLQLIMSSVVTYYEMKSHLAIRKKIFEIEAKLDARQL